MILKTVLRLLARRKLPLMLGLDRASRHFYRLSFVHSAASSGLLEQFEGDPVTLDELLRRYAPGSEMREVLAAWLALGVRLGVIRRGPRGYRLRGLAAQLARRRHDDFSALLQEVVGIHHPIVLRTPEVVKRGEKWKLEDHDGKLIARSSRILEPFILEAIDRYYPSSGPARLLEVGCGSAVYMRYAARRNPGLTAIGLELQADVAGVAVANTQQWGLADRIAIECHDVLDYGGEKVFDIVSLYNNIYYFPVDERVALLRKIHALLKPGGFVLLATGCQRGGPVVEMLNLLCVSTEGYDRLPFVDELQAQLREAGFRRVAARSLIPGDNYCAFVGYRPALDSP